MSTATADAAMATRAQILPPLGRRYTTVKYARTKGSAKDRYVAMASHTAAPAPSSKVNAKRSDTINNARKMRYNANTRLSVCSNLSHNNNPASPSMTPALTNCVVRSTVSAMPGEQTEALKIDPLGVAILKGS